MSLIPLSTAKVKKYKYKCPDCVFKFIDINSLYNHVSEKHSDIIPENNTVKQYVFNRRYKKTRGSCVIDKRETAWNEAKCRYERYCSDRCKKKARERFKNNAKRKLGVENPASLPEHQLKAIKGRSYSGTYKFKDGGEVDYSSSYEKDFLEFLETEMDMTSNDVETCEIIFDIIYENKKRFHIPDFYIRDFNLIIQIKTFKNMNSHIQNEAKIRQKLSDKAIIDDGNYNYIVILDKEYSDFVNMMKILKDRTISVDNNYDRIIHIPKY